MIITKPIVNALFSPDGRDAANILAILDSCIVPIKYVSCSKLGMDISALIASNCVRPV